MIFVDTRAWFAALFQLIQIILTPRTRMLGEKFFQSSMAEIYFLTEDDIRHSWSVFIQYEDKSWSFRIAASKVVIEQVNIPEAFAFDHHFRQFGRVVPSV